MTPPERMDLYCRYLAMERAELLEREAKVFVDFGYSPDELVVVVKPDGSSYVSVKPTHQKE